jgi:HK97 family phage prohead protease
VIFSQPLVLKFAPGADSGTFAGFASSWARDRHGDEIMRGAFADSIAALHSGKQRVPLLNDHSPRDQLGGITGAEETDDGLRVEGRIIPGTASADRALALARADQLSLSVGFMPLDGHSERISGGGKRFKRVDLVEISAVAAPANRESRILAVKNLAFGSTADLERMLREGELPALPRRLAEKIAKACRPLLAEDDDEPDPALKQIAEALARLQKTFQR